MVCEFCTKGFENFRDLDRHERIHLWEKPFYCTHCHYQAETGDTLTSHMRTHFQEKPYKCPEPGCHYAFVTSGRLERHSVVHSGEKPFVCQMCDEPFDWSSDLRIHMEEHRVPKAFKFEPDPTFTLPPIAPWGISPESLAILMRNRERTPPPGSAQTSSSRWSDSDSDTEK